MNLQGKTQQLVFHLPKSLENQPDTAVVLAVNSDEIFTLFAPWHHCCGKCNINRPLTSRRKLLGPMGDVTATHTIQMKMAMVN